LSPTQYHWPRVLARAPRIAAQASIIAAVALASPVGATWKPEYANQPLECSSGIATPS